jgi:hypothetical protein
MAEVRRANLTTDVISAVGKPRHDMSRRMPEHAAALVAEGHLKPKDFVLAGSRTNPARIRVGCTDLATLPTLPPEEQRAAVVAAAEALPDDVVAHRLGDFVFTYHGIRSASSQLTEPGKSHYSLWKAVASPDPDFNKKLPRPFHQLSEILGTRYPGLDEQNDLRVSVGLAPIPDPETVCHGEPVAAPANARHAAHVSLDGAR